MSESGWAGSVRLGWTSHGGLGQLSLGGLSDYIMSESGWIETVSMVRLD